MIKGVSFKTGEEQETNETSQASNENPSASAHSSSKNDESSFTSKVSKENLGQMAQDLLKEISAKRIQDEVMMTDFKKALENQMAKTCQLLENGIFERYEYYNNKMQTKLHDLSLVLERIAKLESEMLDFREALESLFKEI